VLAMLLLRQRTVTKAVAIIDNRLLTNNVFDIKLSIPTARTQSTSTALVSLVAVDVREGCVCS